MISGFEEENENITPVEAPVDDLTESKPEKKKFNLVFAKNKTEAIFGLSIFTLFVVVTIVGLFQYVQDADHNIKWLIYIACAFLGLALISIIAFAAYSVYKNRKIDPNKKKSNFVFAKNKTEAIVGLSIFTLFVVVTIVGLLEYTKDADHNVKWIIIAICAFLGLVLMSVITVAIVSARTKISQEQTVQEAVGRAQEALETGAPAKKKKMQFAKNKTEAIIAIVVIMVFAGKMGYNVYSYYANIQAENKQNEAAMMAQNQQNNLKSLNEDGTPVDIGAKMDEFSGLSPDAKKQMGNDPEVDIIARNAQSRAINGKRILIAVDESGRLNPFMPAGEGGVGSSATLPKFDIITPPEAAVEDSDAGKVMSTVISGILYDKYSPSAILNIDGTDYLVKRGDTINKYHVLSINKDQVIVQLGRNIYKAGVGEILASGEMNYNTISNLNKKFGGHPNDISIEVKKRNY